jgi:hypothetical protein
MIATALASPVGILGVPMVAVAVACGLAYAAGAADAAFAGALVATLAGVIAGLPIALWIARQQQRSEDATHTDQVKARRELVLGVLRQELNDDLDALASRDEMLRERGPYDFGPELRTSTWEALSAGGELAWVDAPELLDALGRTYHWIAVQCDLERHYRAWEDDPITAGARFAGTRRVDLELINHMLTSVIASRDTINETLRRMAEA